MIDWLELMLNVPIDTKIAHFRGALSGESVSQYW